MQTAFLRRIARLRVVAVWVFGSAAACTYDFDQFAGGGGSSGSTIPVGAGQNATGGDREQPGAGGNTGARGAGGDGEIGGDNGNGGTPGLAGADPVDTGGTDTAFGDADAGGSRDGGYAGGQARGGGGGAAGKADLDGSTSGDSEAHAPDGSSSFDCASVSGVAYQGHCYYLRSTASSWDTAAAACAPSHLATFTSAQELAAAKALLSSQDCWIGLRKGDGGTFQWVTSEPTKYSNWAFGEPNGSGDCARMRSADGLWADQACAQLYPTMCERE